MRIAVFNTFDISPAQNGGEIRMMNIYSRLSKTDEVRVISYDLRGKNQVRRETLLPALEIIDTMVTDSDRWAFFQANERLGLYPHDVLCIDTYTFSPHFIQEVRRALDWAEVVVVSHPFLAREVFSRCSPLHLRVFEALNVEVRAKTSYFAPAKDRALADEFVAATRRCERYALDAADIVLTVGEADSQGFVDEYDVDSGKLHIVPNGVTVGGYDAIPPAACEKLRAAAGLGETDVGIFLGSAYGPNVDSYRMSRQMLDQAGFKGTVFIIGSISDVYDDSWEPVGFAEEWLGFVDDKVKHLLVKSADFAIQLMTSGGGTNLKLFDYMASGVPILANSFGRRGVGADGWFIPVETNCDMANVVAARQWRSASAFEAAARAREIVLEDFDWNSIAKRYRAIVA